MDLRELPLDDLILDPNLNLRDRLDEFTVERYTESWGQMPPVTVFEVEGRWLLADGFHRHAAAVQLGRRTVPADVRPGTFADALDHAATVNLAHGLPLSRRSVGGRSTSSSGCITTGRTVASPRRWASAASWWRRPVGT